METYGQMVARVRDERGWTQKDLAQRSGVPLRTLQDVELDVRKNPQRTTRMRLAAALGIEGTVEGEDCPVIGMRHSDVPDDAVFILKVITAWLLAMGEQRRQEWFLDQNRAIFGKQGAHP